MKSPKKTAPVLPKEDFVLWAMKLAEIISSRSGEAIPAELQVLIDKLKSGKLSVEAFQKGVKKLSKNPS